MAYKNRRKQKQKKNAIRQARERMFAERREQARGTQLMPFEAVPLLMKAMLNKKERSE